MLRRNSCEGSQKVDEEFDIYKCETNKLTNSWRMGVGGWGWRENKQIGSNGIFHVHLTLFILFIRRQSIRFQNH